MEIVNLPGADSPNFDAEYQRLANSDSAYDARVARMMLDFLAALRREPIGPRLFASHILNELWLQYSAPGGASILVAVTVDSPDYGPLDDGLPQFHYRLSYKLRSSNDEEQLPVEERARSIESACEFVGVAIAVARDIP
tara:strand:- start:34243 stop:34659 length:417 start_codon:yes stop_codon:yes gene_type:complete